MSNHYNTDLVFPHPVLGNSDDIDSGKFIINAKARAVGDHYEFRINIDTGVNDTVYENLINDGKAIYSILIYSPQTLTRLNYHSTEKTVPVTMPSNDLRGIVEIQCFLIAKVKINEFRHPLQNSLFKDCTFDIKKGDWLGVSNKIRHFIEPQFCEEDHKSKKPIITIDSDANSRKDYYRVERWNQDQLSVRIPKKMYDEWYPVKKSRYTYINWCAILLPVLTDAINLIESEGSDELQDLKWYYIIEQELEKNTELELNSFEKAQILLKGPFKKLIGQLVKAENIYQGELES